MEKFVLGRSQGKDLLPDGPPVRKGFGYTKRLWIFLSKNHVIKEFFKLFLSIFIILSDIEESIIRFSDFYLFRVQR